MLSDKKKKEAPVPPPETIADSYDPTTSKSNEQSKILYESVLEYR